MPILTILIGVIFIIISLVTMSGFFSKNEWRAPLLELSSELEGGVLKKMQLGVKRRGLSLVILFLVLFNIGGVIILRSLILQNYRNIILIVLGILLLWLLKGAYELIRTFYSRKTKLLNYLFSPYLFAWRRDHLIEYSDQEIASAICRVCNIHDNSLIQENTNLKNFLIALHRKTRPSCEHKTYPKILKENIAQAEQMVYI
jgi:hypothetical protein